MNTRSLSLDLTPLAVVSNELDALRSEGWVVTDGIASIEVALTPALDPRDAVDRLTSLLEAAINVEVVGELDGLTVVVRATHGVLQVASALSGDPKTAFANPSEWDDAEAANNGDANAALRLPMKWRVTGTFTFDKLLPTTEDVTVTVSIHADTVTQHIITTDFTKFGIFAKGKPWRVFVALDAAEQAQLGFVGFAGPPSGNADTSVIFAEPPVLAGERIRKSLPAPASYLQWDGDTTPLPWRAAAAHLRAVAAQLVWRQLATSEFQSPQDSTLTLTFHGYKKSFFELPVPESWDPNHVEEAIGLRDWAFHDSSPDRLLAIRQVVSLYDAHTSPFAHAADIQASAEVIYTGLRTDAVVEAVKSSREAHAHAQEAARQTVKNATELVKGATERMLASLVAIGAVLMANAGRVLPDETGRLLLLLVAGFLFLLAASSVLLEGPMLALPAAKLREDLKHQAGLLTDSQRDAIDRLPSLIAARCRTCVVRWTIPFTFIGFAILLICFGHPGSYTK